MSAVQVCVLYKITKVHLKPRACTHVNIDNYNDYFNQPNHLKDVKFGERERERERERDQNQVFNSQKKCQET